MAQILYVICASNLASEANVANAPAARVMCYTMHWASKLRALRWVILHLPKYHLI